MIMRWYLMMIVIMPLFLKYFLTNFDDGDHQ